MSESEKVSRRGYMKYVGGVVVVAVVAAAGYGIYQATQPTPTPTPTPAPTPTTPSPTPTPTPVKKYAGQTLRVLAENFPYNTALTKLIPEFEEETGAQVIYDPSLGWEDMCLKISLDVESAGVPEWDVWDITSDYRLVIDHAYPMDKFIENPEIVNEATLALDDMPNILKKGGKFNGKTVWFAATANPAILVYRRDLLDKYGVEIPTSLDELLEAAKKLHHPKEGVYGFSAGFAYWDTITFATFGWMQAFGAEVLNKQTFLPQADTAEMREFLSFMKKIYKYMPPESIGWGWTEQAANFQSGGAAMGTFNAEFVQMLRDQSAATYDINNLAFSSTLKGPSGHAGSQLGSEGWSINEDTKVPELAYKFIEWAISKDTIMKLIEVDPESAITFRPSILKRPEMIKRFPWYPALEGSMEYVYFTPMVRNWFEFCEVLGEYYQKVVLEQMDVDGALKALQTRLTALHPERQAVVGAEV